MAAPQHDQKPRNTRKRRLVGLGILADCFFVPNCHVHPASFKHDPHRMHCTRRHPCCDTHACTGKQSGAAEGYAGPGTHCLNCALNCLTPAVRARTQPGMGFGTASEEGVGSLLPLLSNYAIVKVEKPAPACKYFLKGECKHGSACRFRHDVPRPAGPVAQSSAGHVEEQMQAWTMRG
eukprot:86289-Amphidinium_carterae.1